MLAQGTAQSKRLQTNFGNGIIVCPDILVALVNIFTWSVRNGVVRIAMRVPRVSGADTNAFQSGSLYDKVDNFVVHDRVYLLEMIVAIK